MTSLWAHDGRTCFLSFLFAEMCETFVIFNLGHIPLKFWVHTRFFWGIHFGHLRWALACSATSAPASTACLGSRSRATIYRSPPRIPPTIIGELLFLMKKKERMFRLGASQGLPEVPVRSQKLPKAPGSFQKHHAGSKGPKGSQETLRTQEIPTSSQRFPARDAP